MGPKFGAQKGNKLGSQLGQMSITKLSPNWACQMGPIHFINFLLSGTSFDMTLCSVQLIFSVLRHIFISKASNHVMSSFLRIHVSAQYMVALQISVFTILS